jgi:hypothetical protein
MFFINKLKTKKSGTQSCAAIRKKRFVGVSLPSPGERFHQAENPSRAFYRISGQKARFLGG